MADRSFTRRSRPGFGGGATVDRGALRAGMRGPRATSSTGGAGLLGDGRINRVPGNQYLENQRREEVRRQEEEVFWKRIRRSQPCPGGGVLSATSSKSNMLRRRFSPTMVLVLSLCFIGFIPALYIFSFGKLSRTAAASA